MAISRRYATAVLPLLCVLLLTGCATPSAPPLSSGERDIIRAEIDDRNWWSVAGSYPQAIRPDPVVEATIDDRDWSLRMVGCLRDTGFTVNVTDGYFSLGTDASHSSVDYAISTYVCRSMYPTLTQVIRYLNRPQLEELYHYYVGSVRPCLLLAGVPAPTPPTRLAFVLSASGDLEWNPFQQVWDSGMPSARVAYLEQQCPPIPPWLDLRE